MLVKYLYQTLLVSGGRQFEVNLNRVSRHKFISVAADVFFFDGIAFLLTVAIKLKFVTVERTPVCTAKSLVKHIKLVIQVYDRAGFTVRYIMMDGEFEKVK